MKREGRGLVAGAPSAPRASLAGLGLKGKPGRGSELAVDRRSRKSRGYRVGLWW